MAHVIFVIAKICDDCFFRQQGTQTRGVDSSGQQFLSAFSSCLRKGDPFTSGLTGKYGCSPMVHYRVVFVAGMLVGSESAQERETLPVARMRSMPLLKGISIGTDGDTRIRQQHHVHQRN